MNLLRQQKIKINVYPKDPQKVDKRGFYIRVYYGQKQRLDKITKKPLFKNGEPITTSDKEEIYFSDYVHYPNPKNETERRQNKHLHSIVTAEAEKYRVSVNLGKWKRGGLDSTKLYLMDYMINTWMPKQNYKAITKSGYTTLRKHFIEFSGRDILISQLDKKTCIDFYNNLQIKTSHNGNRLSESAYKKYMKSFKYYLEQIFNDNIAEGLSPAKGIRIGIAKTKKANVFLEKHELEQFEQLDTPLKPLQRAYLFASYSAITKAELKELRWRAFSHDKENDKWYVNITRKKTGINARLEVNKKAMSFILPEGKSNELVFTSNFYAYNDLQLKRIMLDAGITKHPITFHTSKHNFASMYYRLNNGGNLGRLMKALQHKDLSTTQRYLAGLLGTETAGGGSIDF
jgi:site-specific recombinase XerC